MQVNKQKCSGQDGGTGGRKQCCVKLELFICHACHKDVHLECLQRTRTVDRQEREDILDSEVNWRCADCVSSNKFRPSVILEEVSQIHGKGRMERLSSREEGQKGVDVGKTDIVSLCLHVNLLQ